jgi:hypothetical protein
MMMRLFILGILLAGLLAFIGCADSSVEPKHSSGIRLVLAADTTEGSAPLTVHFTGTLHGNIDTLEMCVPAMVLCPGYGKLCIQYCLPDTSQPAQRVYTAEETYESVRSYKAVMVLQSKQGLIRSDSLLITVLP